MYTRLTHAFEKLRSLFTSSPPMKEEVNDFSYVIRVKDYEPLTFVDDHDRNRFLQEMHRIRENAQLQRIINSMARQQVDESVLLSQDMNDVNFSRATVNGFHIVEREVEKYATLWDEEHKRGENFDKYEILNG